MNNKGLLLSLVRAEDEKEVQTIVSTHPILSEGMNWQPYGGPRGNFRNTANGKVYALRCGKYI